LTDRNINFLFAIVFNCWKGVLIFPWHNTYWDMVIIKQHCAVPT